MLCLFARGDAAISAPAADRRAVAAGVKFHVATRIDGVGATGAARRAGCCGRAWGGCDAWGDGRSPSSQRALVVGDLVPWRFGVGRDGARRAGSGGGPGMVPGSLA
ncbi:hypothetical protein ES705_35261 [subsurface metagenome]